MQCAISCAELSKRSNPFAAKELRKTVNDKPSREGPAIFRSAADRRIQVGSVAAEFNDPRDNCDFWLMRADSHPGKLAERPKTAHQTGPASVFGAPMFRPTASASSSRELPTPSTWQTSRRSAHA